MNIFMGFIMCKVYDHNFIIHYYYSDDIEVNIEFSINQFKKFHFSILVIKLNTHECHY
jgi:hypothetical protein